MNLPPKWRAECDARLAALSDVRACCDMKICHAPLTYWRNPYQRSTTQENQMYEQIPTKNQAHASVLDFAGGDTQLSSACATPRRDQGPVGIQMSEQDSLINGVAHELEQLKRLLQPVLTDDISKVAGCANGVSASPSQNIGELASVLQLRNGYLRGILSQLRDLSERIAL